MSLAVEEGIKNGERERERGRKGAMRERERKMERGEWIWNEI